MMPLPHCQCMGRASDAMHWQVRRSKTSAKEQHTATAVWHTGIGVTGNNVTGMPVMHDAMMLGGVSHSARVISLFTRLTRRLAGCQWHHDASEP